MQMLNQQHVSDKLLTAPKNIMFETWFMCHLWSPETNSLNFRSTSFQTEKTTGDGFTEIL